MAVERKVLDVEAIPGLAALVDELQASGETRIITRGDLQVAELRPVKKTRGSRPRKTGVLTKDDSLWNIVGIAGDPDDPNTDVSSNKHRYLADAYGANAK